VSSLSTQLGATYGLLITVRKISAGVMAADAWLAMMSIKENTKALMVRIRRPVLRQQLESTVFKNIIRYTS
jgi:hypothetical protein